MQGVLSNTTAMMTPEMPSLMGLIQNTLGANTVALVNMGLVVFAVAASLRSAWYVVYGFLEETCVSTVRVNETDSLYNDVVLWMNNNVFKHQNFRSVQAVTKSRPDHEDDSGLPQNFDPDRPVSYKLIDNTTTVALQPFHGSRRFTFRGRWIMFSHSTRNMGFLGSQDGFQEREYIKLQCVGMSLSLLREFLQEARLAARQASVSKIDILRALPTVRDHVRWTSVLSRPSRDISTVILEKQQKQAILRDINEYLHPHTRQWYANHGIPYRRGYLFSGPPGTGKTSLASAIAGVFGLDVYVLSLRDPKITESQFTRLFNEVPPRCVVLLEDIDTAGVQVSRARPEPTKSKTSGSGESDSSHPVSLSGLLNALDGVASQEGRILIMSTNEPEKLDRALVRPGRVDLHIRFALPSWEEIRELFLSMFRDSPSQLHNMESEKPGPEELEDLATQFAEKLPERKYSIAEVQGFLLQHKRKPAEACALVGEWLHEMQKEVEFEKKETGTVQETNGVRS